MCSRGRSIGAPYDRGTPPCITVGGTAVMDPLIVSMKKGSNSHESFALHAIQGAARFGLVQWA